MMVKFWEGVDANSFSVLTGLRNRFGTAAGEDENAGSFFTATKGACFGVDPNGALGGPMEGGAFAFKFAGVEREARGFGGRFLLGRKTVCELVSFGSGPRWIGVLNFVGGDGEKAGGAGAGG